MTDLNPTNAFIFRIAHVACVPWILQYGLHSQSSSEQDPNYIKIGSNELISKRAGKSVPIPPGGSLSDYVPFYFTPYSVMMFNIHTGRNVPKQSNEAIVIFVSSLHDLQAHALPFVFPDQHALAEGTEYFNELVRLDPSTGPCSRTAILKPTKTTRGSSSVIKPKPWCTAMFRLRCCVELLVTTTP